MLATKLFGSTQLLSFCFKTVKTSPIILASRCERRILLKSALSPYWLYRRTHSFTGFIMLVECMQATLVAQLLLWSDCPNTDPDVQRTIALQAGDV